MFEGGIGYYHTISHRSQTFFQVFAGIGFGKFDFTDIGRDQNNIFHGNYHQAAVTKLFVQPAFIIKTKKLFTASLSSRFSLLYFHNIQTNYNATELDNYKLDSLTYRPRLFWEPAGIYSIGFKKLPGIQVEVQASMSWLVSKLFIDYRSFNFSIGLMADLPKMLKKNR